MSTSLFWCCLRWFYMVSMILVFTRLCHCAKVRRSSLYGTKTMYNAIFDGSTRKPLDEESLLHPPNCEVLQLNMVFRHGFRYPSLTDLNRFVEVHESKIKGQVTSKYFRKLNEWSTPFDISQEKKLAALGAIEIQDIAARFQKHLLKLPPTVSKNDLKFISSDTQRTVATAKACINGILGEAKPSIDPDNVDIDIDNKLLRFYDYCPTFIKGIKDNHTALAEMHKFKHGELMQEIARNVSARLGLPKNLSTVDLKMIPLLAAYEEAILGSSLWEEVLTVEELETMEYSTDLKSYWRKAYGYELNYMQSCPLIGNIFKYMNGAIRADIENETPMKGVFRFGHAETIIPLIATMGLFKPRTPLRADNFHDVRDREFRSSFMSPMSGNVALVLYTCNPEMAVMHDAPHWPQEFSQYMVQVLVNEQVVKLPFCEHSLCPFEIFEEHFQDYVGNCQFEEMCTIHRKTDEL